MTSPRKMNLGPRIGEPAPTFVLGAYPPSIVRLEHYLGKRSIVLAFYPGDSLPGSTIELQAFSRDLERFQRAGASVFGISRDSLESHKTFAKQYDITVPLLSDKSGAVCQAYGVMEADQHRPERKTFVIDKHGLVCHIVPYMPDTAALLEIVEAVRES